MGNLTDVQVGSVVLTMVEDVPSDISGIITTFVDNEVYFAEQLTGDNISVSSIGEKYQPAIISLTASAVVRMMEMTGADVSSLRLGDLNIGKGASSPATVTSTKLREDGIRKLENLGFKLNYFKALG